MAIKIHVYVSLGFVGDVRHQVLEFEDGTPDDTIERECAEWKDDCVEWGWSVVTENEVAKLRTMHSDID